LATYVQDQINAQFEEIELKKSVPYQVWGPKETGQVKGSTADERRVSAAALAEKIHAHILIYGVIVSNGKQSKFMPEFYVNNSAFRDAAEISGMHELGNQLLVALPLQESVQAITNPALAGRVNALNMITIGLAYYSIDRFEEAIPYFQKAADDGRWVASSGKEVVYLLLGNAYVRLASRERDSQYLPLANEDYSTALSINPNYGRGLVGRANILYLEALGSLSDLKIDPAKLDEAEALSRQALALTDQPESANVPAKAHFNLGQIDLARYRAQAPVPAGEGDWIAQAKDEFSLVVSDYEAGDTTLTSLAAHAYFRLGECDFYRDTQDPQAFVLMEKAISLASPFYQAEFTALMGNKYLARGEKDKAIQAYQDAIALAESNGDAKSAEIYQQVLDKLNQP
jgi:tetratricopeptide (TPR) repeat protein